MSDSIIKVENLAKSYIINHEGHEQYTALRDVMANRARKIFSFGSGSKVKKPSKEEFWALKDVSFDINRGDRVGIIGRNGAGKSTLLKVLSRITEPTKGKITIKGRVASLLEVGTGFHPELTGRENIFLNGAILGMSRSEIKTKFDEIVAFAEIEKFLDTPVKRYSSGMYVRLAFAVAAHLEPEILVIDEVLAVGDAAFQKKCLGKMQDVSLNEGRTVLFVSHNIAAILELCTKGIYLDQGKVAYQGSIRETSLRYKESGKEFSTSLEGKRIGNESFVLNEISVTTNSGPFIDIASGFSVMLNFSNELVSKSLGLSVFIKNDDELLLIEAFSQIADNNTSVAGVYNLSFEFPPNTLNAGTYSIGLIFAEDQKYVIFENEKVAQFTIENRLDGAGYNLNGLSGIIRPAYKSSLKFQGDTNVCQ